MPENEQNLGIAEQQSLGIIEGQIFDSDPPFIDTERGSRRWAKRSFVFTMGCALVGGILTYLGVDLFSRAQEISSIESMLLKTLATPFGATLGLASGLAGIYKIDYFRNELSSLNLL